MAMLDPPSNIAVISERAPKALVRVMVMSVPVNPSLVILYRGSVGPTALCSQGFILRAYRLFDECSNGTFQGRDCSFAIAARMQFMNPVARFAHFIAHGESSACRGESRSIRLAN